MNNSQNNPLVSICIPTYNSENTIKQVLDSVLNQTYQNVEVVICDDQSKDKTLEIVKTYIDNRIRLYINPTNLGLIGNFNEVLQRASGEYVKILCADDIITLNCIEKQLQPFLDFPEQNIAMVTCEKLIINQNGKTLFHKRYPGKEGVHNGIKVIRKVLSSGSNLIGEPGTALIKNEIALKTSGYSVEEELSYVVDLNFWIKMLLIGDLYVIKEPLFSFRVSKTSASASYGLSQSLMFNRLIDKYSKNEKLNISPFIKIKGYSFAFILTIVRNLIFKFAN